MTTQRRDDAEDGGLVGHPLAALFPTLGESDLQTLADDIAENGLHHPIIIFNDTVLDGRNRLAACKLAGVEPKFEDFNGTEDEALALVLSLNLTRRHLTTAQKAAVGVRLLGHESYRAANRRRLGAKHGQNFAGAEGKATDVAGRRTGVSGETVRKAKKLAADFPLVFEAMEDGTVRTMGEAERLASLNPERRKRVLTRMRKEGLSLKHAESVRPAWSGGLSSSEWYTPEPHLEAARKAMGGDFDLDPASHVEAQMSVKAGRYFTAEDDGLAHEWHAERLWLNPPYGVADNGRARQDIWISKLLAEVDAGRTKQACLLIRAATETHWFAKVWAFPICFIRGRVHFIPGPGAKALKPTINSALVGVGVDHDAFVEAFSEFGHIVLPSEVVGTSISAD